LPALALLLLLPALAAHSAFGDAAGDGLVLEVSEKLTPDLGAAPVVFSVRNDYGEEDLFSGGGHDALESAGAWQLQIFDQGGRKISFVQGRNRPSPDGIPWSGTTSAGAPLPDGFYKARFVWLDAAKRTHATGEASVSLFTPLEIRKFSDLKLRVDYTGEGLALTFTESLIFRPGESRIKDEALPALRGIVSLLKSYPENQVLVRGHTDATGAMQKNLSLSLQRAAGVSRYLESGGIAAARLSYKGLGSAQPVVSNATEAGRARNRRVEVVILKTTF